MKRLLMLLVAVPAIVAVLSYGVMAQENEKKSYESFSLGELYVTGEKLPASVEVTQSVEITAEQIEATHSQTVAEALSYVPGVLVTTGRKNEPFVGIHGLNQSRTLVLIDGVPYYETKYGSLDLNSIPVDNVAKIEVQKGVTSVIWGPNALAGVVNIVTKKPTARPSLDARAEIGQYEANRLSLSHGMKKGIFNYWIGFAHTESEGWYMSRDYDKRTSTLTWQGSTNPYPSGAVLEDGGVRENSDSETNSVWAKFGIEPSEGSEYYLNFHYIDKEKGAPASILDGANRVNTRRGTGFSQLWRMPMYNNWGVDLSGQQKLGNRLTLKGKIFYHGHVDELANYRDIEYENKYATSRYKDNLFGGSLLSDFKLTSIDTLRFAFHYRRDEHKQRAWSYLPFEESVSYTGSLALENELNPIKNLSIVAGLSYDWFDVSKAETSVLASNGDFLRFTPLEESDAEQWNPMFGVTYSFSDSTKVFGSWARKIRFPTLSALYASTPNPDLKPEKSMNYVLGVSRGITKYAKAELSGFYYDVKDLISKDSPEPTSMYLNYNNVTILGFEFLGEVFPTKNLSFRFGYTYENATDRSHGAVVKAVRNIPEHKVDLGMRYLIPKIEVTADVTGTYVGRVWGQLPTGSSPTTARASTGEYWIFDVRLSKMFAKHFEVYVAGKNLFDKDYEQEVGFPAPGRNLFAGVKYSY